MTTIDHQKKKNKKKCFIAFLTSVANCAILLCRNNLTTHKRHSDKNYLHNYDADANQSQTLEILTKEFCDFISPSK